MRIAVIGESSCADVVRGYLRRAQLGVVDSNPDITIKIDDTTEQHIVLDSVDSELERLILRAIRRTAKTPILIETWGGNESDKAVHLRVPASETERLAVEKGILQGMLDYFGLNKPAPQPKGWRRFFQSR